MDLTQCLLLALLVFTGLEGVKQIVPTIPSKVIIPLGLVLGVAVTFLVGTTVWAHEQVIGGHALDTLNGGSKVVGGLLIGAGAVGLDKVQKAVKNIGENQG